MLTTFDLEDLKFIESCRAGHVPISRRRRVHRRGTRPMSDEERREHKRDWQRRRREDPFEREKDRAYARDHYYRNREKRLRQMKEYQQRQDKEASIG